MDIIKDKPLNIFMQYAIPSVLGMLAISSASIVDGFFVGNYVGASGLAAINMSIPIFSLLFGLGLMLAVEMDSFETVYQVVQKCLDKGIIGFWFISCNNSFSIFIFSKDG